MTWVEVPPVTVRPIAEAPSVEMFTRLVGAAQRAGWTVDRIEPAIGTFRVRARGRRVAGYELEVECYADGLVRLTVADVARDPESGVARVPESMRREIVELASALEAAPPD